jgi:hypothetical protein
MQANRVSGIQMERDLPAAWSRSVKPSNQMIVAVVDDAKQRNAVRRARTVAVSLVAAHIVGGLASTQPLTSFLAVHRMEVFLSIIISQAGLLGIWLGLTSAQRKNRLLGGLLGLVYLGVVTASFLPATVPLSGRLAYTMLVFVPCLCVALVMRCARWRGAEIMRINNADAGSPGLQFSIRHLLVLTSVIALIFGLKPTDVQPTLRNSLIFLAAIGLCALCVFLGGVWATLAVGRPAPRILVVFTLAAFTGALPPYYIDMKPDDIIGLGVVSCIQAAIVMGSVLAVRALGYRLVQRRGDGGADGTLPPRDLGRSFSSGGEGRATGWVNKERTM